MMRFLLLSAYLVGLWDHNMAFRWDKADVDGCPPSADASHEVTERSKIQCASICELDNLCLGFCYNPNLQTCRTFRITLTEATTKAVADQNYIMYFPIGPDYGGFSRMGKNIYEYHSWGENVWWAVTGCGYSDSKVAVPTHAEENSFIRSLNPSNGIYLGIDRSANQWISKITGEEITYFAWAASQPNSATDANCVFMDIDGLWHNVPCSSVYNYVCQRPI